MSALTIELPVRADQTEFNLRRWQELQADPAWASWDFRIETDRHGFVLMSPPAGFGHSSFQFEAGVLLHDRMPTGRVMTECPISTADGVKAADAAWVSPERLAEIEHPACPLGAPEICEEVILPSNTRTELREKRALCFAAGARECWECTADGTMALYHAGEESPRRVSALCPKFPARVTLAH